MSIERAPCKWAKEPGRGNYWLSGCNRGTPLRGATLTNFRFCPFCGNPMHAQDTGPKAGIR